MNDKIPPQRDGAQSNAYTNIVLPDENSAKEYFRRVKNRFLNVSSWDHFAGREKAKFELRDQYGNPNPNVPKVGDYISVQVPLLSNTEKDGYDWVRIEEFEDTQFGSSQRVYMRLRPSPSPLDSNTEVAHFLDDEATNNLEIRREGTRVSAEVHARNETPNKEETNIVEKVRDYVVGLGGMLLGSKIQWQSLTDGLINNEE